LLQQLTLTSFLVAHIITLQALAHRTIQELKDWSVTHDCDPLPDDVLSAAIDYLPPPAAALADSAALAASIDYLPPPAAAVVADSAALAASIDYLPPVAAAARPPMIASATLAANPSTHIPVAIEYHPLHPDGCWVAADMSLPPRGADNRSDHAVAGRPGADDQDGKGGRILLKMAGDVPTTGYLSTRRLAQVAVGLNIEGPRPTANLPRGCKWYNLVQSVDEPLKGDTFDEVMRRTREHKYDYIEQAVGINIPTFLDQLASLLGEIKARHKKVLVHVHQYRGTTILDKTLARLSGLHVILDETNFFEGPLNYAKLYPDIDALVSLSQCAGLGTVAGQWILPTHFLRFDANHSLLFSEPLHPSVPNSASELKLSGWPPVVKGPLLFVDGLWNPDPARLDETGVVCLDMADCKVLEFVIDNTTMYDKSHNWEHAASVALNATRILNTRAVLYLALLHDVCDHKYPKSIPRHALSAFIRSAAIPPPLHYIDTLVDRVSFSKQSNSNTVATLPNQHATSSLAAIPASASNAANSKPSQPPPCNAGEAVTSDNAIVVASQQATSSGAAIPAAASNAAASKASACNAGDAFTSDNGTVVASQQTTTSSVAANPAAASNATVVKPSACNAGDAFTCGNGTILAGQQTTSSVAALPAAASNATGVKPSGCNADDSWCAAGQGQGAGVALKVNVAIGGVLHERAGEPAELVAVRDGDRLEALGEIGIWRCETFVKQRGGIVPDDVVQHCYDKLLRLVPENFIQSTAAMNEARRRHNIIVKYVRDNLPKTKLALAPPPFL
jgi:HD superfamily phosphodiesterase